MQELSKKEKRALAKEEKKKAKDKSRLASKLTRLGVVFLVAVAFAFLGYKGWQWVNTPVDIPDNVTQVLSEDWTKGLPEASVVLIEYGDYQCPACASYHPIVEQLAKAFPEDLKVVYRHYPLINIHPNAFAASQAAEAAGNQGKFWELHNMLYERQTQWSGEGNPRGKFIELAEELSLDIDQFKSDMNSSETGDKVSADMIVGNKIGINSTPTFILDGVIIRAPQGLEPFKSLVQQRIDSQ